MAITREVVDTRVMDEIATRLIREEIFHLVSTSSIFVPGWQRKFIDIGQVRLWPDLEGVIQELTPGEAARVELKRFYPDVKMRARKSDFKLLDLSSPRYWRGAPYHGNMYYVDLKGAYAATYRNLTLDCCWPRGMGELGLRDVANRLWGWKTARNSLMGIARSHTMQAVKGRKVWEQKFFNQYFSPHLWHSVQQVLHSLAEFALNLRAIYVNTDCFIFQREKQFFSMCDILEELDYETHVLKGEGHIWGWNSYSLPGKRTKKENGVSSRLVYVSPQEGKKTLRWYKHIIRSHC